MCLLNPHFFWVYCEIHTEMIKKCEDIYFGLKAAKGKSLIPEIEMGGKKTLKKPENPNIWNVFASFFTCYIFIFSTNICAFCICKA